MDPTKITHLQHFIALLAPWREHTRSPETLAKAQRTPRKEKNRRVRWFSFALTLVFVAMPKLTVAEEAVFQAGAATANLTPDPGVQLDGPISKNGPTKGVHDPLKARAVVFRRDQVTTAIVINDMCIIDQEVYDDAKKQIRERLGIPPSHVLLAATHSHATPRVMRIATGPLDEAYRGQVAREITRAVVTAHRNLRPAKTGFGTFDRRDLVSCRRSLCEPGSVGPNPFGERGERVKSVAGTSSKVLEPAGPVDPQVSLLSVRHADGAPLAGLANFSVHYCGGYERGIISADYFGVFAEQLARRFDQRDNLPAFVGMMSNGTSGNTGAVQVRVERAKPWERIEKAGSLLAEQAFEILERIEHRSPIVLAAAASEIEFGVRKPDAERISWAKELLASPVKPGPHRWSRVYAAETLHLAEYPDRYPVRLQVLRIGDVAIVGLPCEVFAETGLAIKARSPLRHTFTISLANGYSGYLPPPQQHAWGGYETWPARSSHLEVQAEPKIVAEAVRLLGEVAREQ